MTGHLRVLLALLLLALAASASLSPWLLLLTGWAALIVGLLAVVNWYRSRVEAAPDKVIATIYERSGKLVLRRRA